MVNVDWNERARAGVGLQSVIDPGDRSGRKNALIDRVQWDHHIEPWARSRRNVLDFGCGIGRFAQRLSSLGISYCGTDTSEAMIEAARRLHDAASAR